MRRWSYQGDRFMKNQVVVAVTSLFLITACNPNSENRSSIGRELASAAALKTVVTEGLSLNGPIVGMIDLEHYFSLNIPSGLAVTAIRFNMGDGSPEVKTPAPEVYHTYTGAGTFTVTATVTFANGDNSIVSQVITVLPYMDGMECVLDLKLNLPTSIQAGTPVTGSVSLPLCLSSRIKNITWNFGDKTALQSGISVNHTYAQAGQFPLVVAVYGTDLIKPLFTFTSTVTVQPAPVQTPPDPLACTKLGETRQSYSTSFSQNRECGVGGQQTMSYRDVITETCVNMRWTETSRTRETLQEGTCTGVACELPAEALQGADFTALNLLVVNGKYYLPSGSKKTFYTQTLPSVACSEVSQTRECTDGVLSGDNDHQYLKCVNGCTGVGPDGTKLTVITGESQVAHSCQYGETGIFDVYDVLSDKTCQNGVVNVDNVRQGELKTAGVCPIYSWVATDQYSACSADCGGEQSQIFECRNQKGEVAPGDRCGEVPVVKRLCDGNPEAVRRTESVVTTEDAGSSEKCPSDQIGTVQSQREATTTKVYACIDHQVQLESTNVTYSPWVTEKTCRDFVPYRCSHDSLSVDEAKARLQWMEKCRKEIPAVEQFLTDLKDSIRGSGENERMVYKRRYVYATFMDSETDKPWIAPKKVSAACKAPSTAFIAAVCVASCATPEQQILGQSEANGKLAYVPFQEAWQKNFQFVATLASQSNMSSKYVQKTKVDSWVTELVDSEHEIIEFRMKSGGLLRLTPNHPVVTDQGTIKTAEEFKVGENLVKHGGERDPIVSLNRITYQGKVYNVFVKSSEIHKNIVLTNGYLNGTAYFQNDGAQFLNRRLLRDRLLKGVFEK